MSTDGGRDQPDNRRLRLRLPPNRAWLASLRRSYGADSQPSPCAADDGGRASGGVPVAPAGKEAFQRALELGHALAQVGELAVDVVESLVDLVESLVDVVESLVDVVESLVDLVEPLVDVVGEIVDSFLGPVDAEVQIATQLADVEAQPCEERYQEGRREPGRDGVNAASVARCRAGRNHPRDSAGVRPDRPAVDPVTDAGVSRSDFA
ncbi:MAG: hypothetical protein OXG04_14700 [Acidobacteria bacterium]|nr:hypothetical protein [Acidobacteriota bacterium]